MFESRTATWSRDHFYQQHGVGADDMERVFAELMPIAATRNLICVGEDPLRRWRVTGGNLERPVLQRPLADIQASRIDIVVVYKVDWLTRSLADFAPLVEILDTEAVFCLGDAAIQHDELTLNVLLSFAQFGREITGERIRDKIAASKKKGMWMGGVPPLGYHAQDHRLVVIDPRHLHCRN
jgi:hypothetical protein